MSPRQGSRSFGAAREAVLEARGRLETALAGHPDCVALRQFDAMPHVSSDGHYRQRLEETVAQLPAYQVLRKLDEALAHFEVGVSEADARDDVPARAMTIAPIRINDGDPRSALAARIPTLQLADARDDLTRVTGITDAISRRLHAFGIHRYGQIAGWTDADRERIAGMLGLPAEFFSADIVTAASVLEAAKARSPERNASEPTPVRYSISGYMPSARAPVEVTTISLDQIIDRIRRGARSHRPTPIVTLIGDPPEIAAGSVRPIASAAAVPGPTSVVSAADMPGSVPHAVLALLPPAAAAMAPNGTFRVRAPEPRPMPFKLFIDEVLGHERDAAVDIVPLTVVEQRQPVDDVADEPRAAPSDTAEWPDFEDDMALRLDHVEAEIEILSPARAAVAPSSQPADAATDGEASAMRSGDKIAGEHVALPPADAPPPPEPLLDTDEADVEIVTKPGRAPIIALEPLSELPLTLRRPGARDSRIEVFADSPAQSFAHADEASVVIVKRSTRETAIPSLAFYAEERMPKRDTTAEPAADQPTVRGFVKSVQSE